MRPCGNPKIHFTQLPMSMKPEIHLHHIAYSPETLQQAPAGFPVLNNLKNERPDWFEYWPIRHFLLNQPLDENAFYGFFSPKFSQKTGLSYTDVVNFVNDNSDVADVFLFSPQPDIGAFFINVFEGGEIFNPGKIDACEEFLATIGIHVNLRAIVMDSREIVFSNYFVAKADFWRQWLLINEQLFSICEGADSSLKAKLTQATNYPNAQRKIFIMEGIASLILTMQKKWRTKTKDPFGFAWSATKLSQFRQEAIISDALKMAFKEQGFSEYIDAYSHIRNTVLNS